MMGSGESGLVVDGLRLGPDPDGSRHVAAAAVKAADAASSQPIGLARPESESELRIRRVDNQFVLNAKVMARLWPAGLSCKKEAWPI